MPLYKKPEPDVATVAKMRFCLICKTSFQSEWSGERICRRCKAKKTWSSGIAESSPR